MTSTIIFEIVLVATVVVIHTCPNEGHAEILQPSKVDIGGGEASILLGIMNDAFSRSEGSNSAWTDRRIHTGMIPRLFSAMEG